MELTKPQKLRLDRLEDEDPKARVVTTWTEGKFPVVQRGNGRFVYVNHWGRLTPLFHDPRSDR